MTSTGDESAPGRELIVCCDGTNETLTAGTQDSNVLKWIEHLAAHRTPSRIVYYDPGVGTADGAPPTGLLDWLHRTWGRVSGLASGRGVYDNISLAYLFLMRNWRDEHDRIYCFGFSRGAFTARAVAGMVNLFGVLKPEHEPLLPALIRIYFSQPAASRGVAQQVTRDLHAYAYRVGRGSGLRHTDPSPTREALGEQVRALFTSAAGYDAWVHWVGVWDTVESVGLPGVLSRDNPSSADVRGKRIRHVRHALAFDEHRLTFRPRLYDEPGDIDDDASGQTLRQRWFAGVHCDVGGGYRPGQCRLSDDAMVWMVDEVADDLQIDRWTAGAGVRCRHDALWDAPYWALAGMCLRSMRPRTVDGQPIAVIPGPGGDPPELTVWAQRRSVWPLGAALLGGAVSWLLSGACLRPSGWRGLFSGDAVQAVAAPSSFALDQLASLWGSGLLAPGQAPWQLGVQPGWSMFWDFVFIACYGYLVARVTSRAFAWLAGRRGTGSPDPGWRWLGMAPLVFVGGDALENTLTWLALAAHAAGTDTLGFAALFAGGLGCAMKCLGALATVPLAVVRLWIAMPGVPRSRS